MKLDIELRKAFQSALKEVAAARVPISGFRWLDRPLGWYARDPATFQRLLDTFIAHIQSLGIHVPSEYRDSLRPQDTARTALEELPGKSKKRERT